MIEDNVGFLKLEVKDTGVGMRDEEIQKISNEFLLSERTDFNIKGTGLGLLIIKKLVDMLDAKITFSSEYEIGSKFEVTIPQKIVGNKKIKDYKMNSKYLIDQGNSILDCSGKKILVVDDNALNRKITDKLLKAYKADVECVSSGSECIRRIKNGNKYDLIFLDHLMPEMNGIDTIRILKKLKGKSLPPIVAMTANMASELRNTYYKEGFTDYLAKPVDTKELYKLMLKVFENNNRR